MKQAAIFSGTIGSDGKLKLEPVDRVRFDRMCSLLTGKRVELSMRKFRKKRSLAQNSWYWGLLIPILSEHLGYDADETHEALKFKFLRVRIDEELETVRSSASLTTEEYSRYMEDCQRLAAEYGCDVPMPNETGVTYEHSKDRRSGPADAEADRS